MIFPRGIRSVLLVGLGAALTWALLALLGRGPGPTYTNVVVDSTAVVRGEPDPEVGRLEGLVRPRVEPDIRATAPGAAAGDVASFCRAAGYAPADATLSSAPGPRHPGPAGGASPGASLPSPAPELADARSAAPVSPAPAATSSPSRSGLPHALRPTPAAVALIRSGRVGRRTSEFWLPTSRGDLVRETYDVRPPVTFRVDGDSVVVQGRRWAVLVDLAPVALCAAGATLSLELDSPVPVAAACGIGAMIVVR